MRCTMHVYDCRCTYACMELHVALYVCLHGCLYACMYVCMHVCMYVRVHVCTYVLSCLVFSCLVLSRLVLSVMYTCDPVFLSVCLSVCLSCLVLSVCLHACRYITLCAMSAVSLAQSQERQIRLVPAHSPFDSRKPRLELKSFGRSPRFNYMTTSALSGVAASGALLNCYAMQVPFWKHP